MVSYEMVQEQMKTFEANIKVIGVGGGGGNAVEHMIDKKAQGITFIAANTDQQALNRSRADIIIPLGKTGLGAGAKPEVGAMAAQEVADRIREVLEGTNLLFITAGMGGGTGTGAAPVIAEIARELGILTVAVVTKPFEFEGARRMRQAQAGIENLKDKVNSLIVILNDKLEDEAGEMATMLDCFAAADDVLYKACNGIAEIIHTPGLINVDFNDLVTVMSERGTAMMGTATASGPDRARQAAEKAISCPLLEGANLQGARGLLVYITASAETMSQFEIRQVMSIMRNFVGKDAFQIMGTAFDNTMEDELRVTVVATGLDQPMETEAADEMAAVPVAQPAGVFTSGFGGQPVNAPAAPVVPSFAATSATTPTQSTPVQPVNPQVMQTSVFTQGQPAGFTTPAQSSPLGQTYSSQNAMHQMPQQTVQQPATQPAQAVQQPASVQHQPQTQVQPQPQSAAQTQQPAQTTNPWARNDQMPMINVPTFIRNGNKS